MEILKSLRSYHLKYAIHTNMIYDKYSISFREFHIRISGRGRLKPALW